MKKPFTAVVKTWQFCGPNHAWAGATAEYINIKHKCLLTECHTHSRGLSTPAFIRHAQNIDGASKLHMGLRLTETTMLPSQPQTASSGP